MELPYAKMICDSNKGDGNLFFYEEYCEWVNRDQKSSFQVYYRDIVDIDIRYDIKKTVIVKLENKSDVYFYLYKADTLKEMLIKAKKRINGEIVVETKKNKSSRYDYAEQLEKLTKLHDSGALTDEEYAVAKQKVLNN